MLAELVPTEIFGFFLVFVRLGAALMLLPGIGERFIPVRIRLAVAIVLTLAIGPVVVDTLPPLPPQFLEMFLLLLSEMVIGVLIGGMARMAMAGLHVAGTLIAFQTSLGFALFLDPTQGTQGALVATFLNILGLVLIFATDLHLLMIQGLADSYILFVPGALPQATELAQLATQFVSGAFRIGVQIAAPFIVYGLVFYISLGILARLMPQFQVFFIALPLQILVGLTILALVLPAAMMWFLNHFENNIALFLVR